MGKVLKYGKKFIGIPLLAVSLYLATLIGTQRISSYLAPRINNQSQLELILKKERKKAGIKNNVLIDAILSKNKGDISFAEKISDKKYLIVLSIRDSNLSILRHELYHIADGHLDDHEKIKKGIQRNLQYLFLNEPQATIYEATGLKL